MRIDSRQLTSIVLDKPPCPHYPTPMLCDITRSAPQRRRHLWSTAVNATTSADRTPHLCWLNRQLAKRLSGRSRFCSELRFQPSFSGTSRLLRSGEVYGLRSGTHANRDMCGDRGAGRRQRLMQRPLGNPICVHTPVNLRSSCYTPVHATWPARS